MHHDSRAYIEIRYDGDTADVVIAAFRDRGIDGVETVTREIAMVSPKLTNDSLFEVKMALYGILSKLAEEV